MPQYFLTLPHDSAEEPTMESMDPAALQEVFAAVDGFNTKLKDDGAWVFAGGLHPPSAATTVDATGDTPILTDGPYVEAKEYLGGFWIIEAPDLDAAIEYAKLGSKALQGRIEVRPFQDAAAGRVLGGAEVDLRRARCPCCDRADLPRGARPRDRLAGAPLR